MTFWNLSCVNFSISPSNGKDAKPLCGFVSAVHDLEADEKIDDEKLPHEAADVLEEVEGLEELDVREVVGGEEMRRPRVGRRSMLPTKAEINEHLPLHPNYRSWCKHCRAGNARLAIIWWSQRTEKG